LQDLLNFVPQPVWQPSASRESDCGGEHPHIACTAAEFVQFAKRRYTRRVSTLQRERGNPLLAITLSNKPMPVTSPRGYPGTVHNFRTVIFYDWWGQRLVPVAIGPDPGKAATVTLVYHNTVDAHVYLL
jgi:hypothetical protein